MYEVILLKDTGEINGRTKVINIINTKDKSYANGYAAALKYVISEFIGHDHIVSIKEERLVVSD